MKEKIGQITLEDKHYPGKDFYCDGAVEDELLEIVKRNDSGQFRRIIEERAQWPVLYHLSPLRENIVDWLPIDKNAKVLEIGSGCGAITGKLAEKAGSVTCVELSKKRSLINAYRHQDCGNVTIHLGNFKDIEPDLPGDFDYICFIGVFEYGQSYIGTEDPYVDWLKMMRRHLKEDGRIVIAIENRLGLKYFAGCMEDHLGTYFSGIEDYAGGGGVRTFVRSRLERMLVESGLGEYSFYYPYPDYKFMTAVYSDERLPRPGELYDNLRNFDRDRMLLFDEKQAFDGLIRDGLFPVFSNSYMVVAGPQPDIKYAKYSNDRAAEYAIRTELQVENERPLIRKYAMSAEASEHIQGMGTAYRDLAERYAGSKLEINECRVLEDGTGAEFEYIEGITLEEILDGFLEKEDWDSFYALFDEYVERISYGEELPVADYDLIFANILVSLPEGAKAADLETVKASPWTVIDYEWTFGKSMSAKETAYRALYCYVLENEKRKKLDLAHMAGRLGITSEEEEGFVAREADFQKFVTGRYKSMGEMRELIGFRTMEPEKWLHKFDGSSKEERVQLYMDRGKGYSEEDSYFLKDAYAGEHVIHIRVKVDRDVRALRVDPAMDCCAVKIRKLLWNGKEMGNSRKALSTNGKRTGKGSYVFATKDPNLCIKAGSMEEAGDNEMELELEIVRLPQDMAADMAEAGWFR